MTPLDATATLRKVAALRSLCRRLPHLPTPAERERLSRFEELVTRPDTATQDDVEALAAGWQAWWREGRVDTLHAMAARLPEDLIQRDRRLQTLWTGSRRLVKVATSASATNCG